MKATRFIFVFTLLSALFVSCTKEEVILDPYGKPEDNQTYTIMMYGCGGGNLDDCMIQNIEEALLVGSSDRVKFTGMVNFSKSFQEKYPQYKGTQRFIIGNTPGQEYTPEKVYDETLYLGDPQNLTDFINWSKQVCPADQYILLLWNHGGGWTPKHDDPITKAIIYDDNHEEKALTLDNLVTGIHNSGTHFKMIYFDACLMGTMEVLAGIKDCADYALGTSHITPGIGGDYNSLIYHLGTNVNFESSMKEYCRETMSHWKMSRFALDLKLVNLNKIDKFLNEVNVFAGYLNEVTSYANDFIEAYNTPGVDTTSVEYLTNESHCSALYHTVNFCYHFDDGEYPFYDIINFAELFTLYSDVSYSAKFIDIASRLNRSWNEALVCCELSTTLFPHDISVATTIVNSEDWVNKHYNTTYNKLAFDQITNWGTWLSKNPIKPTDNPSPKDFILKK